MKSTVKKKNHHARLESSPRLQRLFKALKRGQWRSLPVLVKLVRTYNVGTTVAELRSNGFDVKHRYHGKTKSRASKSQYRLVLA